MGVILFGVALVVALLVVFGAVGWLDERMMDEARE